MVRSSLCDYRVSTSVLAKVPNIRTAANAAARQANERKKLFKKFGSFRQYYRDYPNDNLTNSESCNFKAKIIAITSDDGKLKFWNNCTITIFVITM